MFRYWPFATQIDVGSHVGFRGKAEVAVTSRSDVIDPYATSRGVSGFKRRAASGSALSTRTCPLSPELSGVRQPFNRCELIRLGEWILHLFPQVSRENRNNMRLR